MKDLVLANGELVPRTHDLMVFLGECCRFTPSLDQHRKGLATLNEYSLAGRYPGDVDTIGADDAQKAYKEAQTIVGAILQLAGQ